MPTHTPRKNNSSDRLTVMLFKENYAPKSYEVPLSWLTRWGAGLGAVLLLGLALAFFGIQKWHIFDSVRDLSPPIPVSQESLGTSTATTLTTTSALTDTISSTATGSLTSSATTTATQVTAQPSGLFQVFPQNTRVAVQATSPIDIVDFTQEFRNGRLKITFNLNYTRGDGGSQQGKFILLARGAETLMAYPQNIFNLSTESNLLDPAKGEYFSVSRFRGVTAEFAPLPSVTTLKKLQILIFDTQGELILDRSISLSGKNQ